MTKFTDGLKQGTREAYQDMKDGYDPTQPKKFAAYHWGQLKTTAILVVCFFAYIIYTIVRRGW